MEIAEDSAFVAVPGQVSTELEGEAVLLNLNSGKYYSLNETGARIWSQLQTPVTLSELRDAMLARYDVEFETCDRDLRQLIAGFAAAGLIEVNREAPV
jgi:hypothetical protein